MKLAVYMDLSYRRDARVTYAEVPFALFLAGLSPWFERLQLVGRLDPAPGRLPHRLPDGTAVVGLPSYKSAADARALLSALPRTLWRFWRVLSEVNSVLIFGPHPLSALLVLMAAIRRRGLVLGVRQHYPDYIRHRHPGRRWLHLAAAMLEAVWHIYARWIPTLVVGPDLARSFVRSRRLLVAAISLVEAADVLGTEEALSRYYGGEIRVLSVGRLDPEKNPLLLADIASALSSRPNWRLVVCGDGSMKEDLSARLVELGVEDKVEVCGYLSAEDGLRDLYRTSHLMLHVSLTEGFPQVLFEAFAAGLPTVATAVGGVGEGDERDALVLIPPEDACRASAALEEVAEDADLRERLVRSGLDYVRGHTIEAECRRVASFVGSPTARRADA